MTLIYRKRWMVKFFVGDVVHHWWTGRQGVVVGWEEGNSHMTILFDDGQPEGCQLSREERRKSAFVKGESWLTFEERLDAGWWH